MARFARPLLVALLASSVLAPVAGAAPARTTLNDVEDEVMCLVCGVPLALGTALVVGGVIGGVMPGR